jgi:NDP-sugar pyrophosphorylase family protein
MANEHKQERCGLDSIADVLAVAGYGRLARLLTTYDIDWPQDSELCLDAFEELCTWTPASHDRPVGYRLEPTPNRTGLMHGRALIHQSATLHAGTQIVGDVLIGPGCEVGPNAVIFGPTVISDEVYLGPGSEVRRALLMSGVRASHQCYVGHSLVGRRANLAAGFCTAVRNLKRPTVRLRFQGRYYDSKHQHFGAIIGDDVEFGCQVLIMPGRTVTAAQVPSRSVVMRGAN